MGHNSISADSPSHVSNNTQSDVRNDTFIISELKLLSLNVCGLRNKLRYPEFVELINSYDLIGVQETKLDDADCLEIPGYTIICHNRQTISRYRSGGTALIAKNSILPYLKLEQSNSKLIQWFSITTEITNTEENIHCGIVYIPPAGSKYASEDPYFEIQHEIDSHCGNSKYVILFGDFNSRTGKLPDFVIVDEFLSEMYDNGVMFDESMNAVHCLLKCNVSIDRASADLITNAYGNQMLEFCKSNDLFILNGRLGTDAIRPKLTCKDRSTVDYFISSPASFEHITDFKIDDFSSLFSDAHCALKLTIKTKSHSVDRELLTQTKKDSPHVKLWSQGKDEQFTQNFDFVALKRVNEYLETICKQTEVSNSDIDRVVGDIELLFKTTCVDTFGYHKQKAGGENKNHKPWFNQECRIARNIYHKTRRLYNKYKTNHYKNILKSVSKDYKQTMNRNIKRFHDNKIEKIRALKSENPKEYWRIINDGKPKKCAATLNNLYKHFQTVNNPPSGNNEAQSSYQNDQDHPVNQEINLPISEGEITEAVKSLKRNKSPGIDDVMNEHIINTLNFLLPVYVKLFNIIFDHSIIPENWLLGNILSIYKKKGDIYNPENYRPISLLSCLGKLFTTIINNRLSKYAETFNVLSDCQAGFRKG